MPFDNLLNKIGFVKKVQQETCGGATCYEVEIQDGKTLGNVYSRYDSKDSHSLGHSALNAAYERISCVATSIDLIANNIQMIEPVFWDDEKRESMEYPTNKKLKALRRLFEKPNSVDNRKSFLAKCVKNYELFGVIYFAFYMENDQPISIKIIDDCLVNYFVDNKNARIDRFTVINCGIYSGEYKFNGSYYINTANKKIVLAPYMNTTPDMQYLPTSPLDGCGIETLMYWYGCFHNQSLLKNGARPSLAIMINQMLNPHLKEQLREDIKIRHSGSANTGNTMILDGAADKKIQQLSQNNKDMEFSTILQKAERAIQDRLGTSWVLKDGLQGRDYDKALEMFYDMTICPLFQGIYNHLFDVYKYFNTSFSNLTICFLEQDVPALRGRFLEMMKNLPTLGIFTVNERRKAYNYPPLNDFRGDELTVQSVNVYQQGMGANKQNTTSFSGGDGEG